MSEIRHDRISGAWSIVAPERGRRPMSHSPRPGGVVEPPFVHDCPFCPGNERLLPSIIQETPASAPPGWQVRVVPNRYPAVEQGGGEEAVLTPSCQSFPGFGRHEVIVEHPRHDRDLATMSQGEVLAVMETYRARYRAMMDDANIQSVVLFRNHGDNAGASIAHPHSQVVGLATVPPLVRERAEYARRYHTREGRCPFCDLIVRERKERRRVVAQNDHFLAVVPFAAQAPFEIWLVPLAHGSSFRAVSDRELHDLSGILHGILGAYRRQLHDPEYNFAIHSSPREQEQAPHLHWFLQILPRLATAAGFELGTGMQVNPSVPENDAALLAKALMARDADHR